MFRQNGFAYLNGIDLRTDRLQKLFPLTLSARLINYDPSVPCNTCKCK